MTKNEQLPTYCTSHNCPTHQDMGPGIARCETGGELFFAVDGRISDKPKERPIPKPEPHDYKRDEEVMREERAKEKSLLPGSFPRWLTGPRFEIDEHGHKKTPESQSSVLVLPNSSDDISRLDTEAEKEWKEKHSSIDKLRHFIPKTIWKTPCPKCGKSWNHSPGDCQNPEHFERYQAHLKANRKRHHTQ